MNGILHDEHCTYEKRKAEYDAYVAMHPNFCRKCGGMGFIYYQYDPSPAGVSLGSGYMVDVETCPECVDNGRCPICQGGIEWVTGKSMDDEIACLSCGFRSEDNEKLCAPPAPECYCWEREFDRMGGGWDEWLEQLYEDRQAADYDPFNDDLCQ